MSEPLKSSFRGPRTGGFYFGGEIARAGLTVTTLLTIGAVLYILGNDHHDAYGWGGGEHEVRIHGDTDHHRLGTDRPADEHEDGRRVREREGGRSREAARGEYTHWKSMSDKELLDYYHEHYEGLSRGKLQQADQNFYRALRRRGLLDEIPTADGHIPWSSMSDREILDYYHKHYEGLSRGKLREIDQNLYHELWKRGLLEEISTVERRRA